MQLEHSLGAGSLDLQSSDVGLVYLEKIFGALLFVLLVWSIGGPV